MEKKSITSKRKKNKHKTTKIKSEVLIPYKISEQCDFIRSLFYKHKANLYKEIIIKFLNVDAKNFKKLKKQINNEYPDIKKC